MVHKQSSVAKSVNIEGYGLHTGQKVKVTIRPAIADTGIRFRKVINGTVYEMPADANLVKFSDRCTTLENDYFKVMTIEHLMSAFIGLQVHNVWVEIEGEELPILDGSSSRWVDLIKEAGIVQLEAPVEYTEVSEPFNYVDEETGAAYTYLPDDSLHFSVAIDFSSEMVSSQYASWSLNQDYEQEIAPCRTFVFLHDVLPLLQNGLIKGGSLDNAIVITEKNLDEPTLQNLKSLFPHEQEDILKKGVHARGGLKFNNELARHKLLDLMGDIGLVNRPIKGKIFGIKPSHKSNVGFAKALKKHLLAQSKMVHYDPNKPPIFTNEQVAKLLPHRFPFLLVDKIIHMDKQKVIGVKNVTFNEYFFQGHFPDNPVMPGVLQIEALAQVGGVLAMKHMPEGVSYDTYFLKIDNTKFKRKVVPGDTLLLKMELIEPIRRGICKMQGTAFVGNQIVTEAELTAQIVARN